MDNLGKQRALIIAVSIFALMIFTYFVFAAHVITPTSTSVLEDISVLYNITVNNSDAGQIANITQVNITLPAGFTFTSGTNQTDAIGINFTNTSTVLSWSNFTVYVINGSALQRFTFNATAVTPGTFNITVSTRNSTFVSNSNVTVTVNSTTSFSVAQNIVYLNRTENTPINLSITAQSGANTNITLVALALVQGESSLSFVSGSNRTTATEASPFTNTSSLLIWNTSMTGFPQQSTRNFLFNVTVDTAGTATLVVNVTRADGASQASTQTFVVNFAFSGYVKNETGNYFNGTNISIYQYLEPEGGSQPPVEVLEASVLTDANGSFRFASINGSSNLYKIKIIYRNASGIATKTGSILPPFPAEMFYPQTIPAGMQEFMKPPTLNGTTFYLEVAATLRLNATNGTIGQRFGYHVTDQRSGFDVASNIFGSVATADVVVPVGRNYTVMMLRGFTQFPPIQECTGAFMNDSNCPSPPVSNSTLGNLVEGGVVQVIQNLAVTRVNLIGCINIASGSNNSIVNITSIIPKFVPWPGFLPPGSSDTSDVNITRDLSANFTRYPECNNTFAFYNLSLIGSAAGINYMLEFYAKNASNEAGNPGNANNLAGFQNVSIVNATNPGRINITLYKLAGAYWTNPAGAVNTSSMKINIQNSTGGAITNSMFADVQVKHSVFGTVTYIAESMTNGTFYLPILNNSNWAKVKVFADDAPPKEVTINLSATETNITLTTMSSGDAGFERINATGGREMFNISSMPIQMRFLRNSQSCNVVNPSLTCEITTMNATDFNPFKALVAGKINMEMKIISSGTTLMFMNFDMFSAKQPPMESVINNNATSGAGSSTQDWQFGSFVPAEVYEYALVGMPYSDSVINDSASVSVSIPYLYDGNWQVVWNISRGDTSANFSDEFADYNASLYRNFTISGGIVCSTTDSNLNVTPCFVNTTANIIWQRVPHFSGEGPRVSGSAPVSGGETTTTTSSGGGGGSKPTWTKTMLVSDEQLKEGYAQDLEVGYRFKFKFGDSDHYVGVLQLTSSTAKIEVGSIPQQIIFSAGETKKFDLTDDGYYDIQVTLESIVGSKATINIKSIFESIPSIAEQPITQPTPEEEPPEPGITGEVIEGESGVGAWVIILLIVLVIVITFVIVFFRLKKEGK